MKLIQTKAAIILKTYLPPHIMQMVLKKRTSTNHSWMDYTVSTLDSEVINTGSAPDISRSPTFLKIPFENRALLLKLLFKLYVGQQHYLKCKWHQPVPASISHTHHHVLPVLSDIHTARTHTTWKLENREEKTNIPSSHVVDYNCLQLQYQITGLLSLVSVVSVVKVYTDIHKSKTPIHIK